MSPATRQDAEETGGRRDVVILGAGVCGLAAALRLLEQDPGRRVVVLEAEERPGGLARSLTLGGHVADLGPHRIYTELPDIKEFLRDIAGPDLVEVRRRSQMWFRKAWIEYPPRPTEILPLLGIGAIARVGASFAVDKLRGAGDAPESYETVMRGAFGTELYRLLVRPYTHKVWKVDPSLLHADIARVRVSAGGLDRLIRRVLVGEPENNPTALKKFHYIPGGVEQLVGKLVRAVESRGGLILTAHAVTGIHQSRGGQFHVRTLHGDTEHAHDAAAVISTIPLVDLVGMLTRERPSEAVDKACSEMGALSNHLVALVVNRPRLVDSQWLYFPERDTIFNRAYLPANFHSSMGAAGSSMIVVEVTCMPGDKIERLADGALVKGCIRGLARTGLLRPEEVVASSVHRIPNTYPVYDLQYDRRLEGVLDYLRGWGGLITTGRQGLFLHNNMDHSMHMGFRAAQALAGDLAAAPAEYYREVRRFQQFRIVD